MHSKKNVTLRTIADKLNVTPITVSKALRDRPDISESTKERVRKLANEYGYKIPTRKTRIVRRKRLLGILIPTLHSDLFTDITRGMSLAACKANFELIFMVSNESEKSEKRLLRHLVQIGIDGLAISPSYETKNLFYLNRLDIPIITFMRHVENSFYSSITLQDEKLAFTQTEQLIKMGYHHFCFLGPLELPSDCKNRYMGFSRALELYHLPVQTRINTPKPEILCKEFSKWLEKNRHIEIVFCAAEFCADSAQQVLADYDMTSVLVITPKGLYSKAQPTLSQAAQESHIGFVLGQRCIELLVEEVNQGKTSYQKHISLQVNFKLSSRLAKKNGFIEYPKSTVNSEVKEVVSSH